MQGPPVKCKLNHGGGLMTGCPPLCYQRCESGFQFKGRISPLSTWEASMETLAAATRAGGPLHGRVKPPGDKSISHRALILGLLCVGETEIEGLLEGGDVLHTAAACAALGAKVERRGEGRWLVRGCGIGSLLAPRAPLDFGNAATGMRLMMGVAGGHAIAATFDGDASLRKRPMQRILDPLCAMGAEVLSQAPGGRCPILLKGTSEPIPVKFSPPVASAQIKSAVLLAGLNSPGRTTVIEAAATRDHTEKMLKYFGASIETEPFAKHGQKITLEGRPDLRPARVIVPSDPSSAAFPLVAATIVPRSDIVIEGMMMNPLRTGLLTTLREMGARIDILDRRAEGGEDVADLRVRAGQLKGVDVPAARAPSMIDEYPILAVAAAYASGATRMRGLAELRVKESDRLGAVADGLREAGAACQVIGDDLIVEGRAGDVAGGGMAATHLDHRIAMSFLCLGLASRRPMAIDDSRMIATSFPGFRTLMEQLGARFQ
jgi:3-phosphoshikimate 1-carboxyvinyltransferase